MTSPSLSWIDRTRFASLLERSVQKPTPASTPRLVRPKERAAPQPTVAFTGPKLFVAPGQALESNLQALVHWIEATFPCRAAFIADDNGLPVVESPAVDANHMAATSSVLLLLTSVRDMLDKHSRWVSLRTDSGVLHFLEVETSWGQFGVGVLVEEALALDALPVIERAVLVAFDV